MTPQQIDAVKSSWLMVLPIADQAAEIFYNRLFEVAPEVKPMFKGDIKEQGKKLMQVINTAVTALDNLDPLIPTVQELAIRHVDYGVKNEHYDVVGSTLLWTLEQGLREAFTPDVKNAWTETYVTLSSVMKEAASGTK